jgi:hypothetical protein
MDWDEELRWDGVQRDQTSKQAKWRLNTRLNDNDNDNDMEPHEALARATDQSIDCDLGLSSGRHVMSEAMARRQKIDNWEKTYSFIIFVFIKSVFDRHFGHGICLLRSRDSFEKRNWGSVDTEEMYHLPCIIERELETKIFLSSLPCSRLTSSDRLISLQAEPNCFTKGAVTYRWNEQVEKLFDCDKNANADYPSAPSR